MGTGPPIKDIVAQGLSHMAPIRVHPSKAIATGPRRTQTARTTITVTRRALMVGAIIMIRSQGVKDSARPDGAPLSIGLLTRWPPAVQHQARLALAPRGENKHADRLSSAHPGARSYARGATHLRARGRDTRHRISLGERPRHLSEINDGHVSR